MEKNEYYMLRIWRRLYSERIGDVRLLKLLNIMAVTVTALSFVLLSVYAFLEDVLMGVRLLLAAEIPFVVVSVLRYAVNAPRPYDVYELFKEAEAAPKGKVGRSFPSRHTFSAFLIATLFFTVDPFAAAMLIFLGAAMAVSRVIVGIHFLRDVIVGAILGVISGGIGILIL